MIERAAGLVARAADWLSIALLAVMFVVSLGGVAARYLFNAPLTWGDELAMIALLWCVLLADAFVIRDRDHIAFDVVWDRTAPGVRRVMLLLQAGLFGVLFALALPTVIDYVLFLSRERTPALQWRLDVVFLCFAVYLAMLIVRLAAKFVRAAGSKWRGEVSDGDPPGASNIIG